MGKYFTADITWCNCGCTNTKCERHMSNLDRMRGKGYYSVADYSENCPDYKGGRAKEETNGLRNPDKC